MLPTQVTEELEALRAERDGLKAQLNDQAIVLARVQDDLRRAIAESYALYMTSLDIDNQLDLSAALSSILRRIMSLTATGAGAIYLVDDETSGLTATASSNIPSPHSEALAREVLYTGRSAILENYPTGDQPARAIDGAGLFATVALPLHWQAKVIGVVVLHHTNATSRFSLEDLDSLQHLAVQAAIAIHNARTFSQEKQRTRRLTLLYQGVSRITGSLDVDAVTRATSEVLLSILNISVCAIYEYKSRSLPTPLACYTISLGGKADMVRTQTMVGFPAAAEAMMEAGAWVVYQRSDPNPAPDVMAYLEARNAYSLILIPIVLGQRAIGFIELYELRESRRFSPADIETAQALASHIGIAIRHAQLHFQLQTQRINEQSILLKLARALLATINTQEVAEQAVQAAADAFGIQACALYLVQDHGDGLESRASIGLDFEGSEHRIVQSGTDSPEGYALLTRELTVLEDVFTERRFRVNPQMSKVGLRSALLAPLIYSDKVIGLLVAYRAEPRGFTPDDVQLLSLLAYQTVVALERARLFEAIEQYNELLELRIDDRVRQIRAEQERNESILQATGEALIVFDENGTIERVNVAFEQQHGIPADQAMGKRSNAIFGFDLPGRAVFGDKNVWRGEMQISRRDGSMYDGAVTLSKMYDPSGRQVGVVASIRDISYLKEVDRMKDRFISSVSHELRTPLANMKLYQHLIMKGYEERRDHYFGILQRETERLQRLIEDLLMLSRLDSQSISPALNPLNINLLVGTLIEDRMALVNSRGLEIEYNLYQGMLVTLADENMINQAVTNLLANAMNYTPSGGKITVATRLETPDGSPPMVVIEVTDTGLGMSQTDQDRLFDRFYRGTAAQDTGAAGTGLGMAIVKEIMDRHRGSVSFTSELGKGTIFALRIPML